MQELQVKEVIKTRSLYGIVDSIKNALCKKCVMALKARTLFVPPASFLSYILATE